MDKTININLGGTLFSIDEDAYRVLKDYLNAIDQKFRNVPGGNETIEDIEFRIAEIFQSQKGNAGIITRGNVEAMIAVIGRPEEFDLTEGEVPKHEQVHQHRRKMFRNPDDTIIGGVCGGIGTYLNTDPVWIRILFVIFSFFFGFGFFVYLALWLALPSADTDNQKKEMYGSTYSNSAPAAGMERPYQTSSKVGNAFNAVFRALGKACFIIVRILLIIFGTCLVIGGFLSLFAFIMVFIFKYPGAFSTDVTGVDLSYVPDFLNYVISAGLVPYVKTLIVAVVSIPLLALIYGGIRLIFWFRARDGVIWLIGFVVWVLCAAALSILLFNEGIGFAETGKITANEYFSVVPDTLYIRSGVKISEMKVDKEITIPGEEYDVFYISDEKKEIYFRTNLNIRPDDDGKASVEIRKRSAGRSRLDAQRKSEKLVYNYHITGNTLYMDEFFTIPSDKKWSFDYVSVNVDVPEGTVIYMDKTVESLFHSRYDDDYVEDPENRFWVMTEDGLSYISSRDNK
jgi:phage shock protein PspC (stress-responsive transcriptional regulator)